jgi:hypothetical protein
VWTSSLTLDTAKRIRATMDTAHELNPYTRPAMTTPPSIVVGSGPDFSLTWYQATSDGASLSASAQNQVAWYGGVPTLVGGAYVAMPVTTVYPSSAGNIGFGLGGKNQWAHAAEIATDSDKVQFNIYVSSASKIMFQVDGQYVDFTGTSGNATNNTDTFFTLTFASRRVRRIRVLIPNNPAKGASFLKTIAVQPTASFWKPTQSQVLRLGWFGDSYSEGTNGAATVYPIPNAAWPVITGELLGLRDVRQLAVGSTGYVSDASGARSNMRKLIPLVMDQAPFDLLVVAHGYNDSSFTPAAIQAEALACYALLRKNCPNTPIVVLGCQAGSAGPNASQLACEGAISSAVAQMADPFCKFAPVSTDTPTWLNGTGRVGATNASGNSDVYVDPDGAHPTLAGNEYLAFRSARAIRGAVNGMIV